jgi:hypothetical protein
MSIPFMWPRAFQFLPLARSVVLAGGILVAIAALPAATIKPRYYGHETVQDAHGVIAPWYDGLNGQCDWRVRIAAETLKRYPWTSSSNAVAAYPHYVFNGAWKIDAQGLITPAALSDWDNGDVGQRATSVLNGFVDYYRYTGDPAAIAHLTYMADFLVDWCVTPPEHPWPGVFISVPVKGKPYGRCDTNGMIQLDLVACTGRALLRAYQVTGNGRWLAAARHWGDLLAEHCNLDPAADPWPRYANPEASPWKDNKQTGGVTMILGFLDELIRLDPAGNEPRLVAAREAGERYLRDKLLPAWAVDDTWGRYFWDWANPVQNCLTTPDAARYLLDHPARFPNWPADARNILSVFFNRASVAPESGGDVYSGAWAYPESSSCCGRSLWYAPLDLAPAFAQYAVQAGGAWARELALRQVVLQTYDAHENGQTEDNIDGGVIVNGSWFNIAHPMPLRFLLEAMAWLPEELGPSRENHIMHSSAVVTSVVYGPGRVEYSTFDAPAKTVDVLRLAFGPKEVLGDDRPLRARRDLRANGYTVKRLPNGDALVNIRHDAAKRIVVTGNDPQRVVDDAALDFQGEWSREADPAALGAWWYMAEGAGATVTAQFDGNQVRLIGRAEPQGGLADVFLDGEKQLVPIDCWNPTPRNRQVLYYRNGLAPGPHTLKVVARGAHNPHAGGTRVYVDGIQFSSAAGAHHFPSGKGPTEIQRMIFGYTARTDWRDSRGHSWRPATEFVTRLAGGMDSVAQCWWTKAADEPIRGTADPQLYRYGVHATDFWVNVTVGPGKYHARLKWAATRGLDPRASCFDIGINGRRLVERFDVSATAGGIDRVVDLVFNDLEPRNGIIEIRLTGAERSESGKTIRGEAFLQALEIGPGNGGHGVKPLSVPAQ